MEENALMEREIVEYSVPPDDLGETSCYDEKTTRSRLSNWIWNAALSLGKKAVMTGVVILFVPLLLPPFILVSAVGCALALPFWVVFASYACTDKLMSKLMPSTPLLVQEYNQTVLLPEGEREAVKDGVEMRIEMVGDTKSFDAVTYDELSTVGRGHESSLEEKKNRHDHDDDSPNIKDGALKVQIDKIVENIERGEKVAELEEEEDQSSRHKNKKATVAATEDKDKKDSKKGRSSCVEIDQKRLGKRKKAPKRHEKLGGEEKGIVVLKEITDTKVVQETNDKERCIMLNVGNADSSSAGLKEMLDTQRVEDVGHGAGVLAVNEGDNHDNELKVVAGELKHDEKIPDVDDEKVAGGVHSDEVMLFGEEVIWKKMEAIRVVVGYKAPRSTSYLEELKALYLFTGIELPPSSDSAEFNNSLSLLMSVIGLK